MPAVTPFTSATLIEELGALLSAERVLTDERSVCLYAQDVYTKDLPALAVVRPDDTGELAALVAAVTGAGHAIIARGGGMSYTSGYVPKEHGSVIVDMRNMNRVLEINTEDMYVTVQAGCTWHALHLALRDSGCRTPFWGTLSGIHATVGGGVSQNSIFWGSGRHGSAADSVISLEVVLADGSVICTGANARENSAPFCRNYGPDLTGLFSCDTGALGLKATVTLRLIPSLDHHAFLSFDFADYPQLVLAMSEISRLSLADECFAFDPFLQAVRMQRESIASDIKRLAGVMKSGKSVLGALKDGVRVAVAGRGFMKDVQYSAHFMIDERTESAAKDCADKIREICAERGSKEIENSIPTILRANPFTPLNNMIGPNGERWAPVHTLVPHSKALSAMAAIKAVFERNKRALDQHGIGVGFLLATVSTNIFVIEPVFFTPDALNEIHKATVEEQVLKNISGFAANPVAAETTARIRKELIDVFLEIGGIHMQIGKAYPYREGLRPESWRLVEAVKDAVDPHRRVNPGSLGLD